jgi:spore maturation protein CgeB
MWNNRVFEALGVGALMICDAPKGLREEFGDAIVYTSGGAETARIIAYYLEHPDERRRIGERAQRMVKKRYIYSRWARDVHALYDRIVHDRQREKSPEQAHA